MRGLNRVAQLLGLSTPPPIQDLYFDLHFSSGGIGVYDNLAISIPATKELWESVRAFLNVSTPQQIADGEWGEDFIWLIAGEEAPGSIEEAAEAFINEERSEFQSTCRVGQTILFQVESNVNDWIGLWGTTDRLNYLGFSQG